MNSLLVSVYMQRLPHLTNTLGRKYTLLHGRVNNPQVVARDCDLAVDFIAGQKTRGEVVRHGLEYLKALDVDSSSF